MNHFRPPSQRLLPSGAALALALLLALGGCATVDSGPFVAFSASLETLRAGSESHAQSATDNSREQLIQAVRSGELSPADLQLEFTGPFDTRYGFAENEPLYVKYERFRAGLTSLNNALAQYAQSLVLLAGGSGKGDVLPTQSEYDQMTKALNTNAMRASATLGLDIGPGNGALLSTAAIELFKAYLAHGRRQALARAIGSVQPQIETFAQLAGQAVRLLAGQVASDYNARFLPIALATPPSAPAILRLNRETRDRLAALESISNGYRALPGAHRDLASAADRKPGLLAGLTAFNREAERLRGLIATLAQANAAHSGETNR